MCTVGSSSTCIPLALYWTVQRIGLALEVGFVNLVLIYVFTELFLI